MTLHCRYGDQPLSNKNITRRVKKIQILYQAVKYTGNRACRKNTAAPGVHPIMQSSIE